LHVKLTETKILEFFHRILQCVHDLHMNNVLHRDLRPSAFVLKEGKLYITNFFNAILLNNQTIENNEVVSKNTNYRAPENLRQNYDYTKKSDMYSLGVLLYKLTFGELPNRKTVIKKLNSLGTDQSKLLRKLLEEDPNLRLSSTEALYYLDQNISRSLSDIKSNPLEQIKLSFAIFRVKMDFLMKFGNYLYLNKNIGETAPMMHYIVMKKAYLITKSFKEHFNTLKKLTETDSLWQAYEDFLKGIERESLTHLISFQNTLENGIDVSKYLDLKRDLESLDNFSDFESLHRSIIVPLINYPKEPVIAKMCTELCNTFTENERAGVFTRANKSLIKLES